MEISSALVRSPSSSLCSDAYIAPFLEMAEGYSTVLRFKEPGSPSMTWSRRSRGIVGIAAQSSPYRVHGRSLLPIPASRTRTASMVCFIVKESSITSGGLQVCFVPVFEQQRGCGTNWISTANGRSAKGVTPKVIKRHYRYCPCKETAEDYIHVRLAARARQRCKLPLRCLGWFGFASACCVACSRGLTDPCPTY